MNGQEKSLALILLHVSGGNQYKLATNHFMLRLLDEEKKGNNKGRVYRSPYTKLSQEKENVTLIYIHTK